MIKKLQAKIRKLRISLGLFTISDVMFAVEITGSAKDRSDFEWKLKNTLDDMKDGKK